MTIDKPGWSYAQTIYRIGAAIGHYFFMRNQFRLPYGISKAIAAVKKRFWDASPGQIKQVARLGEQGFQAAKKIEKAKKDYILKREAIPRDRSLPQGTAYRVKIIVRYTPSPSLEKSYGTYELDFKRNPSMAMIEAKLRETIEQQSINTYSGPEESRIKHQADEATVIDSVIGIRRRT